MSLCNIVASGIQIYYAIIPGELSLHWRYLICDAAVQGGDSTVVEALQAEEQRARKEHVGMWQYGDPGDDSDEETERPKPAWGRR